MTFIGQADWDRPTPFGEGRLFQAFGGGPFRLAPERCTVPASGTGELPFCLEIIRGLGERDSRAILSARVAAEYETESALALVRETHPSSAVAPLVLTGWSFRFLPAPALEPHTGLLDPVELLPDGLGSARLLATLGIEAGLFLEAIIRQHGSLPAVAEAEAPGISPRLPVVVRFAASRVLAELRAIADASFALPRARIVEYFRRDPSALPVTLDGMIDAGNAAVFAAAMTDRLITRFGRFIPPDAIEDAPVVQFEPPADDTTLLWSLSQPFLATRRFVVPVDLLSAAEQQADRLGLNSVVVRRDMSALPPLGHTRVTALCTLPASRSGVEALGVTLVFPPHPPQRPQAVTATAQFDGTSDIAEIDVRLSPGELPRYSFTTFAVLSDETGTRQVEGPMQPGEGNLLRLGPERFPIEIARIEATPALIRLASVAGACTYESDGFSRATPFVLDSGQLCTAVAVPRRRDALRIEALATARNGSGSLPFDTVEAAGACFDVTAFSTYGPRETEVRCLFDDAVSIRGISILPLGIDDTPANIATLVFTPAEPVRSFRWFAPSPFATGLQYRAHDANDAPWSLAPADRPLVVKSSQLRRTEAARVVQARAAVPVHEVMPRRLGRQMESAPASPEAAPAPVGRSPQEEPNDGLVYTAILDPSKKLYVPRYGLGVDMIEGGQRYQILMVQQEAGSTLTVGLAVTMPPEVAAAAPDANEYPHAVTIELSFLMAPPAGARKTLEFTDVTRGGEHVWAKMTFATLAERDEVYRVITDESRQARLAVRRVIDVEVPERPVPPPRPHDGGGGTGDGGPLGPILPKRLPLDWPPRKAALIKGPVIVKPVPDPAIMLTAPAPALRPGAMAIGRSAAVHEAGLARSFLMKPALANGLTLAKVAALTPAQVVDTLPEPQLSLLGLEERAEGGTAVTLGVSNWADFSDDVFAPAPDLPPGGLNASASRTFVEVEDADSGKRLYGFCDTGSARGLAALEFVLPQETPLPARLQILLSDRRTRTERRSNPVDTATVQRAAPRWRAIRKEFERAAGPEPFAFSPALHPYIIQGAIPSGAGGSQLIRYALSFQGTFHTYLQDAARRSVVYIVPDRFKLARRHDPPFTPFATVRVTSQADGSGTTMVFDYVVAPFLDARRLRDAREQLLRQPQFGATEVEFQPLPTSDIRFFVDRPTQAGSVREQRQDVALVLRGALKDTLVMPVSDFRLLFDAMHQQTAALFVGRVEIDVPNGRTETVPFEARFDDMAGEIFTYEAVAEAGRLRVAVTNAIESPVDIETLDATVTLDGRTESAVITRGALPLQGLQPGESVELTLALAAPAPTGAAPDVAFDLAGVRVAVDAEAVWNAILDRTTVNYFRLVTVKTVASVFDPVAGRESERIVAILVAFEAGGTAELGPDALQAQARIDYPIDDVILGRPVSQAYRYSVTVVREDGRQDRDSAPRTDSAQTFFVAVLR